MEIVEIIKEWAGVFVAGAAAIYGVFKYVIDYRNGREGVRQNEQHTEQSRLATEEKELNLDSRRVKASEEVASEALENLAETREENLTLLDEKYNYRKEIIKLNHRVTALEDSLSFIKDFVCFDEECALRKPKRGTYKPKCLREDGGKNIHS